MPQSPEFVFAALSDMHIGGKTDKKPDYYLSSVEVISAMIDIKEKYGNVIWLFPGDLAHQGNTEFAYELADVIKSAGILYDTKLAINGNHEWKNGSENNKELWKIYQGESNITMVEGVVYEISTGTEKIGVGGFNGYMGDIENPWKDLDKTAKIYHSWSMEQFNDFKNMLNEMKMKYSQNILLMHVPPPVGDNKIHNMFLHPKYGEVIRENTDAIPILFYGHLHDKSEKYPYTGVEIIGKTRVEIASLPYRKDHGKELLPKDSNQLIPIVDLSEVAA